MNKKIELLGDEADWRGKPASAVVTKIVEMNPRIASVELVRYFPKEYSFGSSADYYCYVCREDYLLGPCGPNFNVLWDHIEKETATVLPRERLLTEGPFWNLPYEIQQLSPAPQDDPCVSPDPTLCLASKVQLLNSRAPAHIPMLDFEVPSIFPKEPNHELVRDRLEASGAPAGFILNSGRSYHYYGIDLMNTRQWRQWLKSAGQPDSPLYELVDFEWLIHVLKRNVGYLRLAPTVWQKPYQPKVVGLVCGQGPQLPLFRS